MNTDEKIKGPTAHETLLGGKDFTVRLRASGEEKVFIRQLEVDQMTAYLKSQDEEHIMVELLCGKPAGWAKTIRPEDFETIVEEGERINHDFFSRWVKRRLSRQEKFLPGLAEKAAAVLSASQISSPKSA